MTDTVVDLDSVPCEDFTYFKNALMRHRKDDDNITHKLNTTDTHSEAKCRHLFEIFTRSYGQRDTLIRRCVREQTDFVDGLRAKSKANPSDLDAQNHLRTEQLKARIPPSTLLLHLHLHLHLHLLSTSDNLFFVFPPPPAKQKRLIEAELTAEEIVRERTSMAFKEKCRILFDHPKGH